jgi:hypothetical protein
MVRFGDFRKDRRLQELKYDLPQKPPAARTTTFVRSRPSFMGRRARTGQVFARETPRRVTGWFADRNGGGHPSPFKAVVARGPNQLQRFCDGAQRLLARVQVHSRVEPESGPIVFRSGHDRSFTYECSHGHRGELVLGGLLAYRPRSVYCATLLPLRDRALLAEGRRPARGWRLSMAPPNLLRTNSRPIELLKDEDTPTERSIFTHVVLFWIFKNIGPFADFQRRR